MCGSCRARADLHKNLVLIYCRSADLANGEKELRARSGRSWRAAPRRALRRLEPHGRGSVPDFVNEFTTQHTSTLALQNKYRSANWIWRAGCPAAVTWPNAALVRVVFGSPIFGVLKVL